MKNKKKPNITDKILARWQKTVDLMATVVGIPAGLIMKVHSSEIEVFVSSTTKGNPYKKGEKANLNTGLYCETVMTQRDQLLVPDARKDPEWAQNPDIELSMVSYLGLPLVWPDGKIFGTICVLDNKENRYSDIQQELLRQFSETIEIDLGLLVNINELKQAEKELRLHREHLESLVGERTAELKKTNEQLQQEITERKKAEDQITASLKEKEVLLQEVHHRVKNNMQIISSLFNLQSRHIKDKQVFEIFKSSQNRIRSMALIHERFYQSKDMARVDFTEYTQSLTSHLFSAHGINPGAVKLNLKIKDVFLDLNTAIPCGLIINELVSNSLKHAFPGGNKSEIKIAMHPLDKDRMEVIVSDNGVGLPKKVDFRKTDSLGLHLVNLLAEDQLHGDIKLDRTKGTSFSIRFKVKR